MTKLSLTVKIWWRHKWYKVRYGRFRGLISWFKNCDMDHLPPLSSRQRGLRLRRLLHAQLSQHGLHKMKVSGATKMAVKLIFLSKILLVNVSITLHFKKDSNFISPSLTSFYILSTNDFSIGYFTLQLARGTYLRLTIYLFLFFFWPFYKSLS